MEPTEKKYKTKGAKVEAEFVEKLNELDTVAERTEILEDGIARIEEKEATESQEPISVSPNAEKIKPVKEEEDPIESLKASRENLLKSLKVVKTEDN